MPVGWRIKSARMRKMSEKKGGIKSEYEGGSKKGGEKHKEGWSKAGKIDRIETEGELWRERKGRMNYI
jgi:hypothetical protein